LKKKGCLRKYPVKKISVFCIWRDSESNISQTLSQLEELELLNEYDFSYFFYENDSKDNTSKILHDWLLNKRGKLLSEVLGAKKFGSVTDPERMRFLCSCRNKCKTLAENNDSDYSLLIDSDIAFNADNFLKHVEALESLTDAVMITPNVRQSIPDWSFNRSSDSYYDVYAYRDNKGNNGMYFSDCPSFLKEDQELWALNKPVKALSAFGGFVLIKSCVFNKVMWSADINCDHCNMCFEISRIGQIYILPYSIVRVGVDTSFVNIEVCKDVAKKQKQFYDYIWNNGG
jgi:hypothetical protein